MNYIQKLLSEGSFTSSYKFALLHAIADLCVETGSESDSTLEIPTHALSAKFIRYYWRQVLPYPARTGTPRPLAHNSGGQAEIATLIMNAHAQFDGKFNELLKDSKAYPLLLRKIAAKIKAMPMRKLQTIGITKSDFLYKEPAPTERSITLQPGVSYCFRQFHGLVLDLVQGAWTRWLKSVALNKPLFDEAIDLPRFLFGADRANLQIYRELLGQLQGGRCFYCDKVLGLDVAVDHFVPWSRYQVDYGHNFVLVDEKCNTSKCDFLADTAFLERWCERNAVHRERMNSAFNERNIQHDLNRSMLVAHWAYNQAAKAGGFLWQPGRKLGPVDVAALSGIFVKYVGSS